MPDRSISPDIPTDIINARLDLIAFVILTWNSGHVIDACLRSVFRISTFRVSVVVVDNGSQDNTVATIENIKRELQVQNSLELICLPKNMGTTVSRNIGLKRIQKLHPDYIGILDSDTVVNDCAFKVMISELTAHHEYGLAGPKMLSRDGHAQNSARPFPTILEKLYKAIPLPSLQERGEAMENYIFPTETALSFPVDYLMSACWLMKPELLQKAGFLDEKIFYAPEDAEYCIRIWKSGYKVIYCPSAVITHEWQRLSRKKYFSRLNWEHIKGLIYMFWKHQYCFRSSQLRSRFPV